MEVVPWLLLTLAVLGTTANTEVGQDKPYLTYQQYQLIKQALTPKNLLHDASRKTSPCALSILAFFSDLSKGKPWAMQMFDASAKFPEGLLTLNHEWLGQYDQCLAIKGPITTGQYCLLKGQLHVDDFPGVPPGLGLVFFYGLCMPAACSPEEVNSTISKIADVTTGLITLETDHESCHTKNETIEPDTGGWVMTAVFACLGFFAILSTAYDYYMTTYKKDEKQNVVFSSFSLIKNGRTLFGISNAEGQMGCLNGIRVFSMMWVVYIHCYTSLTPAPVTNLSDVFSSQKSPLYVVVVSAYLAVDSFLLISGLLLTYSFFRSMTRTGTYDVPLAYIHRYLRLTPSYIIILFMHVTIYRFFGDGPMWSLMENSQRSKCTEHWWSSLLYVQNWVNPDSLCLDQTWYLSADMQLYWISPLLLYPMFLWPKIAAGYVSAVVLLFSFLPFGLAYVNGFAPIPMYDTTGLQNSVDNYATYARATPWLIGVGLGYLIIQLKERKIKVNLSPFWVCCGWAAAALVGGFSLFGLIFFMEDETYVAGEENFSAAFYLVFHRLGWALSMAWLIFACINGYGGPIDGLLSWSPMQPMGKLSYSVYLCHISVIVYKYGTVRTNLYFTLLELTMTFFSVYLVAHFIGFLLYIFVEAPFFILDRHFLRNVKIFQYPKPKPKKLATA